MRKFHASGVGIIKMLNLSPEQLAEVREKELRLDSRGYQVSPNVYGQTPPAEHIP
jgi:hypothetical protein